MKIFKIPVSWEVYGVVEIEAETLEEAIQKAIKKEDSEDPFGLPEANYVDGSFVIEIDEEIVASENDMYDDNFIKKIKERK